HRRTGRPDRPIHWSHHAVRGRPIPCPAGHAGRGQQADVRRSPSREINGGNIMRSWSTSAGAASALGLLVISFAVPAQAAEITVLAGMGVISGVSDLAPAYEKLTGHSVVVRFEQAAAMNEKINSGAQADIAALQPEQVDNFIKQGKMVAGTK